MATPRLGLTLAILLIVIAFASNSVITRFIVANELVSAFTLTVVRFFSGLGMLIALQVAIPKSFSGSRFRKTNVLGGILLASYGFSISFGYLFIGAAVGTFIFYASVVLTMSIFSVIAERQKMSSREIIGLAISVGGIFTLTLGGDVTVTVLGVALMIITGVSWGGYSVFGRRFPSSFGYTFYSFAILSLLAIPAQAIINPEEILKVAGSLEVLGLILYFGMISTALSYVLWHKALMKIKASQGGVYQMLIPVVAAAMAVVLLGEGLTLSLSVGGGLILLGIYMNR